MTLKNDGDSRDILLLFHINKSEIWGYVYIYGMRRNLVLLFSRIFSPHASSEFVRKFAEFPRIKYLYLEISCMHYVFCNQTMFSLSLFRGIAFVVATNSCRMWTGVCREEITYGAELLIATAFTNKRVLGEATFPTDISFH